MIFQCSLCGCILYNPFKSYCSDCQKIRRMMLLNDKTKFISKLEDIFLKNEFMETKETYSNVVKRSKTTDDLPALEKSVRFEKNK